MKNKTSYKKLIERNKLGLNKGEKHGLWKGDNVGYTALHNWIKRNLQKPQACQQCNLPKKLDLANISGRYKRRLSDWEWLCRKCHMKKDGRLKIFAHHLYPHISKRKKMFCLRCKSLRFQKARHLCISCYNYTRIKNQLEIYSLTRCVTGNRNNEDCEIGDKS